MAEPKSISPDNSAPETVQIRLRPSFFERVSSGLFRGFMTLLGRTVIWLSDSWEKMQDLPGTNYDLGIRHLLNGNLVDAVFRFRLVLKMQPENGMAWYYLGRAYLRQGKISPGCAALRKALDRNAMPEETRFLLACADDTFPLAQAPANMPLTLITEYFDFVAPVYNTMQEEQFRYSGDKTVYDAVFTDLPKNTETLRILDLGAAAGQVAEKFRAHAVKIVGVDVSRGMAALAQQARDKNERLIFDEYHTMDFRRYLKEHPKERFNLVLAQDVMGHLGDLKEIFKEVSEILATDGLFAFSTEITDDKHGFILVRAFARFGHSPEYIRKLAAEFSMKEVYFETIQMYPEHNNHQWVLKKV